MRFLHEGHRLVFGFIRFSKYCQNIVIVRRFIRQTVADDFEAFKRASRRGVGSQLSRVAFVRVGAVRRLAISNGFVPSFFVWQHDNEISTRFQHPRPLTQVWVPVVEVFDYVAGVDEIADGIPEWEIGCIPTPMNSVGGLIVTVIMQILRSWKIE